MKIYIVLCSDRHSDDVIMAFKKPESAIEFAKRFIELNKWEDAEVEEEEIIEWLYYATYSPDGDFVRVEECELQP
jgi:hypothetical protein